MDILYLSALSSSSLIDEIYNANKKDPGFAVQKFNRLLVCGLVNNYENVTMLTSPPIGRHNSSELFWKRKDEELDGLNYKYISFINLPVLRQLCLFASTLFNTIFWSIRKTNKEKVVVCDVLNASICVAAIIACKITGMQIIGVMTDMPGLMVRFEVNQKVPFTTQLASSIIRWNFRNYDKFVFLTEAMNVVNVSRRPYIVMEGMSDCTISKNIMPCKKSRPRTIMYAGGLHERYGLKMLTEAFIRLHQKDINLHIYGSGPFVKDLREKYCIEDYRIKYMGVVPTEEVVKAELDATLLVNPRPTTEEFTKYSFPSKNIEYMASGTPLLTTKLSGMPTEYYPYVFIIEDETIEGFTSALNRVLSKTDDELYEIGKKAKTFVLEKKNCNVQAQRVIELIKHL